MRKTLTFFCIAFCLFCFTKAKAEILEYGEEKIIFAPEKIQKNVTWSKGFSLKGTGLETEQLQKGVSQDVWILTHAFPIGLSWRPPTASRFYVSFDGDIAVPRIYIRYSCDKINWSTWYEFSKTEKKN